MKYEVEIPDGKYCDEGEACVFLVNAEYDYCQVTGDSLELDLDVYEEPRHFIKSERCPNK